jgi:hypothetical protein
MTVLSRVTPRAVGPGKTGAGVRRGQQAVGGVWKHPETWRDDDVDGDDSWSERI